MNLFDNENLNNNLELSIVPFDNYFIFNDSKLFDLINCNLEPGFSYRIVVIYDGEILSKDDIPFSSLLFHNKDVFSVNKVELIEVENENEIVLKTHLSNISVEDIQGIKVDYKYKDTWRLSEEQVGKIASLSLSEKETYLEEFRILFSVYFERVKLSAQILTILNHSDLVQKCLNKDTLDFNNFKLKYVKTDF